MECWLEKDFLRWSRQQSLGGVRTVRNLIKVEVGGKTGMNAFQVVSVIAVGSRKCSSVQAGC